MQQLLSLGQLLEELLPTLVLCGHSGQRLASRVLTNPLYLGWNLLDVLEQGYGIADFPLPQVARLPAVSSPAALSAIRPSAKCPQECDF